MARDPHSIEKYYDSEVFAEWKDSQVINELAAFFEKYAEKYYTKENYNALLDRSDDIANRILR